MLKEKEKKIRLINLTLILCNLILLYWKLNATGDLSLYISNVILIVLIGNISLIILNIFDDYRVEGFDKSLIMRGLGSIKFLISACGLSLITAVLCLIDYLN